MRRYTNLFLVLFLFDGVVSSIDELLILLTASEFPGWVRAVFAWPVVAAAVPLYICLGIDRRLPKLILLPQILLVFWSVFDLWPLPVMVDPGIYILPTALCQLLLGVAPLAYLKRKHKQWGLPAEMFATPFFRLKNTLIFFISNLVVLPGVAVYMALSVASLHLYDQTGGFARLRPTGLQMTEKVYRHAGKEIRLTGMIHIADQAYFEEVLQSISSNRTIVLAEGVTDNQHHLAFRFTYGALAKNLGLTSQEKMVFTGKFIEAEELQTAGSNTEEADYHILRADIDVNDFDPKTIEFLNVIGEHILNSTSKADGLRHYLNWIKENSDEVTPKSIMKDILHRRNAEVILHLNRALDYYDTIIIPWGALHMPEIETAILGKNFQLAETRQRISIDFKRLFKAHRKDE